MSDIIGSAGSGSLKERGKRLGKTRFMGRGQLELARELEGLKEEPVRLHPNLADLYRRKVATLQDLLGSEATRTEAVELIRSLIDQVTFRPTASDGRDSFDRRPRPDDPFARQSAENSENSPIAGAVHEEFACSVKVVAGTGFEPVTFRL